MKQTIKTTLPIFLWASIFFILSGNTLNSALPAMEEHTIRQIYEKVDLDFGTLDESGMDIDHIFSPTKIKKGRYEIEICSGTGSLYQIKGTAYYVKFSTYYGYAGYGDEGILDIGDYGAGTFYKYED